MREVAVYFRSDYSEGETILVEDGLSNAEINKIVNNKFPIWYVWDLVPEK